MYMSTFFFSNEGDNNHVTIIIVIIVVILTILYAILHILFCYLRKRRIQPYKGKGTYSHMLIYIHTYM